MRATTRTFFAAALTAATAFAACDDGDHGLAAPEGPEPGTADVEVTGDVNTSFDAVNQNEIVGTFEYVADGRTQAISDATATVSGSFHAEPGDFASRPTD